MNWDMIGTPGAQAYWKQRREWFSGDFREAVDEALAESTPSMIDDWHRNK